ncbi:MAG TPA: hypothetical protein ENG03_03640 [Thioploca sp.]|nr:hypothetical protein [Thioploca sp.]
MKKISPSIVLVEDIHSSLPRSQFLEADLDEAAQLILKMEGTITPPILLENGVDSYTVIEGNFEYYAALRAEEIDPLKGETINAYIVESEQEKAAYEKQIKVFRQRQSVPPPTQTLPPAAPPALDEPVAKPTEAIPDELKPSLQPQPPTLHDELDEPIAMMPTEAVQNDSKVALEKTMSTLVAKNEALEQTVNRLVETRDNKLHESLETLTRFMGDQLKDIGNQIRQQVGDQIKALGEQLQIKTTQPSPATPTPLSPVTEPTLPEKPPISPVQPSILVEPPKPSEVIPVQPQQTVIIPSTPKEQKFIEDINTLPLFELLSKLEKIKAVKTVRENIINERQKPTFQPFQSRDDLIERIKGLGKKSLEKMLKRW